MTGVLLALLFAAATASPMTAGRPFERIDAVVGEAIARGDLPGAVVLVGERGRIVFRRAYGRRTVAPAPEAMTADTVFDVASLTKAVATAPAVMILVEEGRVRLADPVVRYVPEFAPDGGARARVTVEELLTHRAGLPPDDPVALYTGSPEEIFARKARLPLAAAPGEKFVYSDAGYEILGELVRRVSGEPLDRFATERIFRPLGMKETAFRPLAAGIPASRIAPTEQRDGRWMRGEVHDPRAFAVGGVAGHAGLFSTGDDLARFCRMILDGGRLGGARVLSPLGVETLTRPRFFGDGDVRSLGFDVATAYSRNRGDLFPPGSFGHTGFTGTSLWIDPASQSFVVFLSNRVHPDGKGDVGNLRGLVATIAAAALDGNAGAARREAETLPRVRDVRSGADVLVAEAFRPIAGKRVGLLTHAAGRTRDGRSTSSVLASAEARAAGVRLERLFSPEHGLASDADGSVADTTDADTGLPVVSLYGPRRRLRPEDLAGLDAVVVDLQDVGVRFYTYVATLGELLEEAAKAKVEVVVLDRPDPLNGVAVAGPLADVSAFGFTAYHSIPVRTGLTMGELARLFRAERAPEAALTVVPLRGWTRDLWYDETGLPWVDPSPNMRSMNAATLYPGIGLLEATNLSVGRGTDAPFEWIGAPWLDGGRLARTLAGRGIPGVTFTPVAFTPSSSTFAGERCRGVRFTITDRAAFDPVRLGVEIAAALRDGFSPDWDRARFATLLANAEAFRLFESGASPEAIAASWRDSLDAFRLRVAAARLY